MTYKSRKCSLHVPAGGEIPAHASAYATRPCGAGTWRATTMKTGVCPLFLFSAPRPLRPHRDFSGCLAPPPLHVPPWFHSKNGSPFFFQENAPAQITYVSFWSCAYEVSRAAKGLGLIKGSLKGFFSVMRCFF